mgnify:FL=1
MNDVFQPIEPAAVVRDGTALYAPRFDDHYYANSPASADGVAETDYVFIDGNALTERFCQLPEQSVFVIGETGFGSGLNFFRAATRFLEQAPASCRLFYYSSEKHPLPLPEFAAIQRQRPWIPAELLHDFVANPAPAAPGFHKRVLAGGRIHLCLLYGDSGALWPLARLRCDAWFLDGFAPRKNPDMWRDELFQALARRSSAGATLATFTAAGFVRRGLQQARFLVERRKGFGGKREMLVARFPGEWRPARIRPRQVAVIGAGLAGSTTARALAELDCRVTVYDGRGVAQGASGNPAGVLYCSATPHFSDRNRFYQSSYFHALAWLRRLGFPADPAQGRLNGVWHLPTDAGRLERMRKAQEAGYWPPEELQFGTHAGRAGACFVHAGYLSPPLWCQRLLTHAGVRLLQQRVRSLQAAPGGWRIESEAGTEEFDAVVLCAGHETQRLLDTGPARLRTLRGQITLVKATAASQRWRQAVCHSGSVIPAVGGLHVVGATFNRGNDSLAPDPADDAANIVALRAALPMYWQELGGVALTLAGSRVGLRCYSADSLPLAGPAADAAGQAIPGLWISAGHGSRGLTSTPLCADLIAAQLLALPLPCDGRLQEALVPARFYRQP